MGFFFLNRADHLLSLLFCIPLIVSLDKRCRLKQSKKTGWGYCRNQNDMICVCCVVGMKKWKMFNICRGSSRAHLLLEEAVHLAEKPVKGSWALQFNSLHQNQQFCRNYLQFVSSASPSVRRFVFLCSASPLAVSNRPFLFFSVMVLPSKIKFYSGFFYLIIGPRLN